MKLAGRVIGAALTAAVLALITLTAVLAGTPGADAGTGPAGFASAAKAGIDRQLRATYGSLTASPWRVTCSERPNYQALTDSVVCHVTHK